MAAPRSTAYTGRYDETSAELREEVTAATNPGSPGMRGRRVALALLDAIDDVAKPADTVNVSVNYSPAATGQINLTSVVTLTPAPKDAQPS